MSTTKTEPERNSTSILVEGEDYYSEGATIVFTARFLLRRGYCCESGCRHCPYGEMSDSDPGSIRQTSREQAIGGLDFQTREAGGSIKPGVEQSGTPGSSEYKG